MSKNPQNIELYKVLYNAYADEIKNLWQRSVFLGVFMVLVWSGYGALQLKAIELKIVENLAQSAQNCAQNAEQTLNLVYVTTSIGLCAVIIVLSWLWIAMAKGSKFVQEAHEAKIKQYSKRYKCNLFCDLNVYQKATNKGWQNKLSFICPLKSYRYSPSKINIALGWVSCLLGIVLFIAHTMSIFCTTLCPIGYAVLVALMIVALCSCLTLIKSHLKGG